jgi:hypothetical protein
MLSMEAILELIERLEQAIRPLPATDQAPDQDGVGELYWSLQHAERHAPVEAVRLAALQEMVQPYLSSLEQNLVFTPETVAAQTKTAIGALVMLLCHLEAGDYEAAATALSTASQELEEVSLLLRVLRGVIAHA